MAPTYSQPELNYTPYPNYDAVSIKEAAERENARLRKKKDTGAFNPKPIGVAQEKLGG